jgi:hypothetical protein
MKIAGRFISGRGSKGMSLVELVMAIGISVILLASISFAIYRVFDTNWRGTTHMVAVKEVENAVHFISRDAEMAQFPTNAAATGNQTFTESPSLVMTWINEFDSASGTVKYTRDGDKLVRTYTDDEGNVSTNTVAQHIDFDATRTNWSLSNSQSEGLSLAFKITATVSGSRPSTETRLFEIIPRSMP